MDATKKTDLICGTSTMSFIVRMDRLALKRTALNRGTSTDNYTVWTGLLLSGEMGGEEWWVNGERHHESGPAVVNADGSCRWYLRGSLHRVDGPAIEASSGATAWYQTGELHREDGPAVEGCDGTREWYNRAVQLSEEEFNLHHQPFKKKKVVDVRSAYDRPVKAVENKILAMRKKYIEGEGNSGIKIRW